MAWRFKAAQRYNGIEVSSAHPQAKHLDILIDALRQQPRGAATRVRAVAARFGAMVRLPSRLVVRGQAPRPSRDGAIVRFEALAEDGRPAVRDAELVLAP